MNVDIAVVSAKHQMSICVMVTLVILTIYMEMTMSDNKYLLQIIQDLYFNVLEDVPDNYYTKHLRCAMDDAWEILCAEGVLKDE